VSRHRYHAGQGTHAERDCGGIEAHVRRAENVEAIGLEPGPLSGCGERGKGARFSDKRPSDFDCGGGVSCCCAEFEGSCCACRLCAVLLLPKPRRQFRTFRPVASGFSSAQLPSISAPTPGPEAGCRQGGAPRCFWRDENEPAVNRFPAQCHDSRAWYSLAAPVGGGLVEATGAHARC